MLLLFKIIRSLLLYLLVLLSFLYVSSFVKVLFFIIVIILWFFFLRLCVIVNFSVIEIDVELCLVLNELKMFFFDFGKLFKLLNFFKVLNFCFCFVKIL